MKKMTVVKKMMLAMSLLLVTASFVSCGHATELISVEETAATTETTAETAVETEEASTEASTETEAVETQPETIEEAQDTTAAEETAVSDTQENGFYQMIGDTLVPQHGLSDLAGFDEDGNEDHSYLVKAIPEGTQGIISAYVKDFDGNGAEECLIIRAEEGAYILDVYNVSGTLLGTCTAHEFTPNEFIYATDLTIYMVDNYLVVDRYQIKMPGYSSYGTETHIYEISEAGGITQKLFFGGTRSPMNGCVLYVNEEIVVGDEEMGDESFASLDTILREELGTLGMQVEGLHFGWDVGEDLNYGIKADFLGDSVLLFEDGYADGLTVFQDHTKLREKIAN